MMKKYIFCIIFLVLVTFQVSRAQSVSYSYDSSGNRTARVIIYSEVNAKNQDSIVDYMDKVLDHDITISPNPIRGQMTVKVENLADSDKCQLHIYSITGALELTSRITTGTTVVDMSSMNKGHHVLLITLNGRQTTWKLVVE